MKKLIVVALLLIIATPSFCQTKEEGSERNDMDRLMKNKEVMPVLNSGDNVKEVKLVLKQYSTAIEKLDMAGTEKLFTTDAEIFESEKSKGNYNRYLEHTLNPKLKQYKSLKYSNYKADVKIKGDYAYANETFNCKTITAKDNSKTISQGTSTIVLRKINGAWIIISGHYAEKTI
ncbi:nuclear transport factor 2 family protein [Flavobacterium sp.]|uniref:YybH family protein n=1 Tax=Flavobacterium sp. TaxID=239 RepID=UPI00260824B8|nr:nuclear transport factor 2 family protein [Flavobacterium sp.]